MTQPPPAPPTATAQPRKLPPTPVMEHQTALRTLFAVAIVVVVAVILGGIVKESHAEDQKSLRYVVSQCNDLPGWSTHVRQTDAKTLVMTMSTAELTSNDPVAGHIDHCITVHAGRVSDKQIDKDLDEFFKTHSTSTPFATSWPGWTVTVAFSPSTGLKETVMAEHA